MVTTKNGVLECLTEGGDPKVNFCRWGFVQDRWELCDFPDTMIQETSNSPLKGRETWKYEENQYTYSNDKNWKFK